MPPHWCCIKDNYTVDNSIYPAGYVKLVDVGTYLNLAPAQNCTVVCHVEDTGCGTHLYHVSPSTLKNLGCDVGTCKYDYPFYDSEVKVINEQE